MNEEIPMDETIEEEKRAEIAEALAIANEVRADREFAARFRAAVSQLTSLMNEAAERGVVITFNINGVDDMTRDPPRKIYTETVSVVKAV